MENQEKSTNRKASRNNYRKANRWLVVGVMSLIMIFLPYYLVMNIIATKHWIREFNMKYEKETADKKPTDTSLNKDSAFISLQREISFIKARTALTSAEPIGLIVNVIDSTAKLVIKGVTVHSTLIKEIDICQALFAIEPYHLTAELSNPLQIKHSRATIEKEPIIVKNAPSDTSEVENTGNLPDTSNTTPVFFELTFHNGFRLIVLEEDSGETIYKRAYRRFFYIPALAAVRRNVVSIMKFKIPEYTPEIRISMPGDEARAIYRAIPEEGFVALRLN
jgi:cytoskeletal protein RodZ